MHRLNVQVEIIKHNDWLDVDFRHGAAESYCCVETFIALGALRCQLFFSQKDCAKAALETEMICFLRRRAVCVLPRTGREVTSIGETTMLHKHLIALCCHLSAQTCTTPGQILEVLDAMQVHDHEIFCSTECRRSRPKCKSNALYRPTVDNDRMSRL